jgi:hypothetical protein
MSNENEVKNDVIISFNGRDFKAEDLNEDQANIAGKLNVAQRELQELQSAYERYVILADYRELQVKAFSETVEEEAEEVTEE